MRLREADERLALLALPLSRLWKNAAACGM